MHTRRIHEGTYTHWAGHEARHLVVTDEQGCVLATVPLGLSMDDAAAWEVARQIAAAPELLEALVHLVGLHSMFDTKETIAAKAVIAKATPAERAPT